jgi:hypothetical protein
MAVRWQTHRALLASSEVFRDHADRSRPIASVTAEFEFEIDGHDMAGIFTHRAVAERPGDQDDQ